MSPPTITVAGVSASVIDLIGAALGFRVTLCVPENVTPERKRILRAYGAELTFTNPLASVQPDSPLHGLEGLKHMDSALVPGIYDRSLADEDVRVGTEEAYEMTRRLAQEEGLLVGISSGANLVGAIKIARPDSVMVVVFCDGGERYLSERFWENPPEGASVGGTN